MIIIITMHYDTNNTALHKCTFIVFIATGLFVVSQTKYVTVVLNAAAAAEKHFGPHQHESMTAVNVIFGE